MSEKSYVKISGVSVPADVLNVKFEDVKDAVMFYDEISHDFRDVCFDVYDAEGYFCESFGSDYDDDYDVSDPDNMYDVTYETYGVAFYSVEVDDEGNLKVEFEGTLKEKEYEFNTEKDALNYFKGLEVSEYSCYDMCVVSSVEQDISSYHAGYSTSNKIVWISDYLKNALIRSCANDDISDIEYILTPSEFSKWTDRIFELSDDVVEDLSDVLNNMEIERL